MPGHEITCPYCFRKFADDSVHFRMETVFSDDDLDPKNEGRSLAEIEVDGRYGSDEIKAQMEEYKLRERFLERSDPLYERFWADFGGTTEKASVSRDGKEPRIMPYNRPVFEPKNSQHMQFFGKSNNERDTINEYGMTYAAIDCFGKQTQRRVCPYCHNPLPGAYGKHPVKFISIIGITAAGKTVYLSQLCKYIARELSKLDIVAVPSSQDVKEYIEDNLVEMGARLPVGSPPGRLLQPLCLDLIYGRSEDKKYQTVVFYDIAGENCVSPERIRGFGKFVEHANGIIIVIDPKQFSNARDAEEPVKVLDTIYSVYQGGGHTDEETRNLPLAICISKGDTIAQTLIGGNLDDIEFIQSKSGFYVPKFNARNYNPIHDALSSFVRQNDNLLTVKLGVLYDRFNVFLFSAIGTSTTKIEIDGVEYDTPGGPTIPKRILEPIVWMLYIFNFIESEGIIHELEDWFCEYCSLPGHPDEDRLKKKVKLCPVCGNNNSGGWRCADPNCNTLNPDSGEPNPAEKRKCVNKQCKCYNENGVVKKKGLLGEKVLNRFKHR